MQSCLTVKRQAQASSRSCQIRSLPRAEALRAVANDQFRLLPGANVTDGVTTEQHNLRTKKHCHTVTSALFEKFARRRNFADYAAREFVQIAASLWMWCDLVVFYIDVITESSPDPWGLVEQQSLGPQPRSRTMQ